MDRAESQLAASIAKYPRAVAKLATALRAKLQARLPGLNEILYVYENQNALVVAYSPSDKGYEGICSIALDPEGVRLCFGRGAELSKFDPLELLQGRGKTVRHVALKSPAEFDRPEVEALIAAALKLAKVRIVAGSKSSVFSNAEAQRQRARGAKRTARPATPRRGVRRKRGTA